MVEKIVIRVLVFLQQELSTWIRYSFLLCLLNTKNEAWKINQSVLRTTEKTNCRMWYIGHASGGGKELGEIWGKASSTHVGACSLTPNMGSTFWCNGVRTTSREVPKNSKPMACFLLYSTWQSKPPRDALCWKWARKTWHPGSGLAVDCLDGCGPGQLHRGPVRPEWDRKRS